MAPLRRRVSRRVVKSTFQECFEYDIPPPKNSVSRRTVSLPASRLKNKVFPTPSTSKKLDHRSQTALKAKTKLSKGIAKKAITRASVTLNKKEKDWVRNTRFRGKNNGLSTAKTEVPETKSSKHVKNIITIKEEKDPIIESENHVSCNTVKSEAAFNSEEWQPVVKMEKLSVENKKHSITSSSSKPPRTRKQTRSSTSRNTRKVSVSDESLLLTSDSDSGKDTSSNISLEEGLEDISVSSSEEIKRNASAFGNLSKSKCSVLESLNAKSGISTLTNDSEDWPEDSSDSQEVPEGKFSSVNKDDKNSLHSSLGHNWSAPHVTQLIHLQEHFHFITNDLRGSFESLKNIIEDKNTVIESFKYKLQAYMENKYHQMLENILCKYDMNDPKTPAHEVIETLKKYAEK